ncbi:ATP-binding protein [Luteimonas deserti]|uniref:Sensory/regulatory protein RpfC n=1 Tax=Luteimonas deserti TaxID=2752306 RepID=A0A7Z0U0J5_9GAMM|nr:ATP-binding protein [Luteimonas deserti]NYZ63353.1 response regulator [Luteimonas deserti]
MNVVGWLRGRLSGRPDSEHGQASIRLALLFVVLVFLLWTDRSGTRPPAYEQVMAMVIVGFGVGAVLLAWILARPGTSHPRRVAGMLSDYGLMGAAMTVMGGPIGWVYVLILWVTVGNGLRFGNRYLYAAMTLAAVSFGSVLVLTPYWHANLSLGVGLLLGLVAIPLYLSGLLRDLTRATNEARRASEAKSRFLANMSHEFRTPLNGLAGVSELLATTRLDGEQREYLATIRASTSSLLALVEDVLDISAIEAGKLRVAAHPFSLREVVNAVDLVLQPGARAKRLDYVSSVAEDVPDLLLGDPAHLRQVLTNLVGNAVKFTREGSVRFDVVTASAPDGLLRLRFTVVDTGIGIPDSARARLFEAFEQADTTLSRGFGGTGLGTSIAKRLTEAMGGTIGFESTENAGSRFWVELPFERVEALGETDPDATGPREHVTRMDTQPVNVIAFSDPFLRHRVRVRSMRVLIADDHAANRMVLERLLQKAGHSVTSVTGAEDVLDVLAGEDHDAIVVDLHMPGMSGLDMLRQMRVMEAGAARTPVIVLSADVTPSSIANCRKAGAYAFLAKPVVASRLLDLLADIAMPGSRPMSEADPVPVTAPARDGVLDTEVLDELGALGLGEDFVATFVVQCMDDARSCLDGIEQAGQGEDWPAMRDHAHALKGVSSNMGLVQLAGASGEIMRLADWQLRREWRQRLDALAAQFDEGGRALRARGQLMPARDRGGDS